MKEAEFCRKKIDGLTILFEKRNLPVVAIIDAIKFGSGNELEQNKGIAHFLEHTVFKGTRKRTGKEIVQQIENKGGSLGAFTATEFTAFYTQVPSKHALLGLDVVKDLVTNPLFDEKELQMEKKVVLEEIRMKHDTPPSYIIMKTREMLYKKPFALSPLGTPETIMPLNHEKTAKFFNSCYSNSNSIVSVVGKADISEIIEQLKSKARKINIPKINPVKINKNFMEKRTGLHQAHMTLAFHAPCLKDRQRYAVEAFNSIFGEGMSSRLFQEVREKLGLAYAVQSMYEQGVEYGDLIVYVGTKKENVMQVKKIILRELKKMQSIDDKELSEIKEKLIGQRLLETETCQGTSMLLLREETAGDANEFYNYADRINALKLEDVRKIAKIKAYSFAALVPK